MKETGHEDKLKSALRQNLRKRKVQRRKLVGNGSEHDKGNDGFSVKLRNRKIETRQEEEK